MYNVCIHVHILWCFTCVTFFAWPFGFWGRMRWNCRWLWWGPSQWGVETSMKLWIKAAKHHSSLEVHFILLLLMIQKSCEHQLRFIIFSHVFLKTNPRWLFGISQPSTVSPFISRAWDWSIPCVFSSPSFCGPRSELRPSSDHEMGTTSNYI